MARRTRGSSFVVPSITRYLDKQRRWVPDRRRRVGLVGENAPRADTVRRSALALGVRHGGLFPSPQEHEVSSQCLLGSCFRLSTVRGHARATDCTDFRTVLESRGRCSGVLDDVPSRIIRTSVSDIARHASREGTIGERLPSRLASTA